MFLIPDTTYALCILKSEVVKKCIEYDSEAELIENYDGSKSQSKVVALAWCEMKDNSMLIWILAENILNKEDDPMDLLMNLYSQIFGFDEDFSEEFS
tara:strand:- start:1758 stop:2048 length:291 start_codon:yes stop_codon:yes gene_type:complete